VPTTGAHSLPGFESPPESHHYAKDDPTRLYSFPNGKGKGKEQEQEQEQEQDGRRRSTSVVTVTRAVPQWLACRIPGGEIRFAEGMMLTVSVASVLIILLNIYSLLAGE
jgi:hypothetical protein